MAKRDRRRFQFPFRVVLGYAAPLLLSPGTVSGSDMAWCFSVVMLMLAWTVLGTIPLPVTSLLPFLIFPLVGVMAVSDLADKFMEDNLVLLLLGMSILVAAIEETSLCTRLALYLLDVFGFRMRTLLVALSFVTFLCAQLLMCGSTALLMCALLEAVMFELQHDVIASSINKSSHNTRHVRTTIGEGLVMTPVRIMMISPRSSTKSESPLPEGGWEDNDNSEEDNEDDLKPQVMMPVEDTGLELGAFYQLSGKVADDPRVILEMDTTIPEFGSFEGTAVNRRRSSILKDTNLSKLLLLQVHRFHKIKKALLINMAHTSGMGSIANLFGSTSGIYLRDYFQIHFGWNGVTAFAWSAVGLPVATLAVVLSITYTYCFALKAFDLYDDPELSKTISEVIKKKRKFLGKFRAKETILLASMSALVVATYSRMSCRYFIGWEQRFSIRYAHEVTSLFLLVLLLSMVPKRCSAQPIICWDYVAQRISWRTLLTVGGGLTLTGVIEWSGLSENVTQRLSGVSHLSPLQTQVLLIVVTSVLAELHTATVIAKFVIPIASDIGVLTNVHPLYYALPVAMASCTSTILPLTMPSIAVVTSVMDVEILDLLYPGLLLKFSSILFIMAAVNVIGDDLFSWAELPDWMFNVDTNMSHNRTEHVPP